MISEEIKNWVREKLFQQVPVNIAVIDPEFRIVEANEMFEKTFGEWQNRHCYELYKGFDAPCSACQAARTFRDGAARVNQEIGVDRWGNPIRYLVHLFPLIRRRDGAIPYIIEMSADTTRMHFLEEQLKQIEEEKIAAERLAAVGQTVSGLAHGIKNIVTGLEGGLYVMQTGFKKSDVEKIRKGLEMLEGNVARISHFVKEFLNFARGRKPEVEMTSPNEIAREVFALYRDAGVNERIKMVLELQEDIADAPLDPEGIHTCLTNLVSNALDACQMSDRKNGLITIRTSERDGTIVYEVSDNGIGMDAEVKKKVFTSFFSTKGSHEGTGIGLLITRKIIQEHGGGVHIASRDGKGSTFRLELPRSRLPKPETGKETEAMT